MDALVEWLRKHWFLLAALTTVSVAWGGNLNKIETLEDAIKQSAKTQADVVSLKEGQSRLDERTQSMIKNQERQEKLLEQLLLDNKQIIRLQRNK